MIIDEIKKKMVENPVSRLAVFIRHGEKDKSDAGPVLLTEKAKLDAEEMGLKLKKLNVPIQFFSSPELRCVQTAKIINQKLLDTPNDIVLTSFLGEPGIQIKNNDKFLILSESSDTRKIYCQWKAGNHYDALRNPEELCSELKIFLKRTCTEPVISIFISQSGTVAALGFALGLSSYDFEKKEWVAFLEGFVIASE